MTKIMQDVSPRTVRKAKQAGDPESSSTKGLQGKRWKVRWKEVYGQEDALDAIRRLAKKRHYDPATQLLKKNRNCAHI